VGEDKKMNMNNVCESTMITLAPKKIQKWALQLHAVKPKLERFSATSRIEVTVEGCQHQLQSSDNASCTRTPIRRLSDETSSSIHGASSFSHASPTIATKLVTPMSTASAKMKLS